MSDVAPAPGGNGEAEHDRPRAPRMTPLAEADWDDSVRELLAGLAGDHGAVPNIFTTLARHPRLFRRWLPFGGALLVQGTLPARERELLILRTAWNCRSPYEWGQHVPLARSAGLDEQEIARVREGPGAAGWEPFHRTLLSAADELHARAGVADETWTALAARYDEPELIELVMLVGHYHMVAFALNSLGVQRDPGIVGLPGADE